MCRHPKRFHGSFITFQIMQDLVRIFQELGMTINEEERWFRAAKLLLSYAPQHLFAPIFKHHWNQRYPTRPWSESCGPLLVDGSPDKELLDVDVTVSIDGGMMTTDADLRSYLPVRVDFELRDTSGKTVHVARAFPGRDRDRTESTIPIDPAYKGKKADGKDLKVYRQRILGCAPETHGGEARKGTGKDKMRAGRAEAWDVTLHQAIWKDRWLDLQVDSAILTDVDPSKPTMARLAEFRNQKTFHEASPDSLKLDQGDYAQLEQVLRDFADAWKALIGGDSHDAMLASLQAVQGVVIQSSDWDPKLEPRQAAYLKDRSLASGTRIKQLASFNKWFDPATSGARLLYISGQHGSGKSALLKHLRDDAHSAHPRPDGLARSTALVASHFFIWGEPNQNEARSALLSIGAQLRRAWPEYAERTSGLTKEQLDQYSLQGLCHHLRAQLRLEICATRIRFQCSLACHPTQTCVQLLDRSPRVKSQHLLAARCFFCLTRSTSATTMIMVKRSSRCSPQPTPCPRGCASLSPA